jgi:hypothetical protein
LGYFTAGLAVLDGQHPEELHFDFTAMTIAFSLLAFARSHRRPAMVRELVAN